MARRKAPRRRAAPVKRRRSYGRRAAPKRRRSRSSSGSRGAGMGSWMNIGIATITMRVAGKLLSSVLGNTLSAYIPAQYVIPLAVFLLWKFRILNIADLDKVAQVSIFNSFWDQIGLTMAPLPKSTSGYYAGPRTRAQTLTQLTAAKPYAGQQAATSRRLAQKEYRGADLKGLMYSN